VPGSLEKKAEEDVTFCLKKDATFSPLFSSNEPGTDCQDMVSLARRNYIIHSLRYIYATLFFGLLITPVVYNAGDIFTRLSSCEYLFLK
jgi:hypothetical protein